MKLSEIGEFGLIEKLARHAGAGNSRLICGIGDDCAVAESGRQGHALLMTTDALFEGVHFRLPTTSPRLLGRKALAVNLSDIAAMGGSPTLFTVTLGLPPETPVEWVDDVYAGLAERASDYRAVLAGGDTAASPGGVSLSIALLGECPTDEVVYRSGARAGESIYVTGHLGESAVGLRLLESKGMRKSHGTEENRAADFDALIRRHLDPEPQVAAGRRLAKERLASAMIDISDGLAADLMQILRRSGVGGTLQARALPLSGEFRRACEYLGIDPVMTGLAGGEEYELLFTGAPDLDEKDLARAMGRPVTRVGSITGEPGRLEIFDDKGRPLQPPETGYDHFRPAASLPFIPATGSKNA